MTTQVYTNLFPDARIFKNPSINKFNVGDLVRINKSKGVFDKGKTYQIIQLKCFK